ncbi:type IA DNA topoisomerase [Texcoconibacillus texcoconensis]|uniref:DNA topoisomerase n=1 Tax=Texcoconibacillus texcoconensis TaxID=1095777 RepID=A0A840QHR8_9BACI|nr:type IA DNA topoisomerase [Texcoconibacillus texcoconensis]MBB5171874.1 DNA topoisomerase-3 [Texcoconibacillus texcoconensis]
MATVLICEKPSQAKAVAAAFGGKKQGDCFVIPPCNPFPKGGSIFAASGHLFELKKPEDYDAAYKRWRLEDLPIIPPQFEHKLIYGKGKIFNPIKKALKDPSTEHIVIACDPGREGAYIGYEIVFMSGVKNKPISYLWSSSLTKKALQKAAQQLKTKEETLPFYHEAFARATSDYLLGINLSRLYSLHIQRKLKQPKQFGVFSIGRVKTPVVKLCVDREREIENFEVKPFWEVIGTFEKQDGRTYAGKWYEDKETRLFDKEKAEALADACKGQPAQVVDRSETEKNYRPPQLMNLADMQDLAERRFKFPPKKTLEVLEQLYLSGYVSYPRTSSRHVTREEAREFPAMLDHLSKQKEYASFFPVPKSSIMDDTRFVNEKKVDDHYALIPTDQPLNGAKVSNDEKKIYDLIAKSLIAAHYDDQVKKHVNIVTAVNNQFMFSTKGTRVIQEGWKVIYPNHKEADGEEEEQNIPDVQKHESVNGKSFDLKAGETKPPKRFTQGSLIKHMEKLGLGTKATRSGIVHDLVQKSFLDIAKSKVYATKKSFIVTDSIGDHILNTPETTAKWEAYLEKVGKGEKAAEPFVERAKQLVSKTMNDVTEIESTWDFSQYESAYVEDQSIGACPLCGKGVTEKKSKKGKFYGCEGYRDGCRFTAPGKILGKNITKTNMKKLLEKGKTNTIKGFKKDSKTFDAALVWDAGQSKVVFETVKSKKHD